VSNCTKCDKEVKRKRTFTENGTDEGRSALVPEEIDSYCVDVEHHSEHQAEISIYFHNTGDEI
jgi:hypothetical protein